MNQKYTYKYRLYPTKDQEVLLAKHFGCCRYIYNYFLDQRIKDYKETKKSKSGYDNMKELPQLKKEFPWLKEVNAQSLQTSIEFLQKTYDNFFLRIKRGDAKPGFPKFKNKSSKQSFRVKQNISIRNNRLIIRKFTEGILISLHKEVAGTIKYATIVKDAIGNYYVFIMTDKYIQTLPENLSKIALDLNVKNLVDHLGNKFQNPLPGHQQAKKLRMLSKDLSRKQKGSKSWEKARIRLAKFYEYCHNVREDFQHKLSKQIIDENQIVFCENLNVESMMLKRSDKSQWEQKQLRKMLQDCAFGLLLEKLKYKAVWYGRTIIQVDRWFPSSQLCSGCGHQYKDLSKICKKWSCPECNTTHDRDHNAAKNIFNEGLRILTETTAGTAGVVYCPDVRPI